MKSIYNFPFTDDSTSYLYKTSAHIYGHYLSGLLLIRHFSNDNYRIVFTNELGVKFFDLEFSNNEFIVHFAMKKLDKKPVMKVLENDFRLLLAVGLSNIGIDRTETAALTTLEFISGRENIQYLLKREPISLLSCESFKKRNAKKASIQYQSLNVGPPDTIKIVHHTIRLDIELNYIKR